MSAHLDEFSLIARYFTRPPQAGAEGETQAGGLRLGVGDDCALLQVGAGQQLAVSTDTLVAGVHFFEDVLPRHLGHKALAVNLSDLAAMGAQPLGFTLALTLPQLQEPWLAEFSAGLWEQADAYACPLIGGDTTRGPLSITITVLGQLPPHAAILRSGARVGDDVYVSGTANDGLGQARAGLAIRQGALHLAAVDAQYALQRLECPSPRVALGQVLRGIASSCLDVSDGLLGDLQHILRASGVGAEIDVAALLALAATCPVLPALSEAQRLEYICHGGDDYELLFTAAPTQRAAVAQAAASVGCTAVAIGRIVAAEQGLQLRDAAGHSLALAGASFQHF